MDSFQGGPGSAIEERESSPSSRSFLPVGGPQRAF